MIFEVGQELRVWNGCQYYDFIVEDIENDVYVFEVSMEGSSGWHFERWSERMITNVKQDGWRFEPIKENIKTISQNYEI